MQTVCIVFIYLYCDIFKSNLQSEYPQDISKNMPKSTNLDF